VRHGAWDLAVLHGAWDLAVLHGAWDLAVWCLAVNRVLGAWCNLVVWCWKSW